MCIIYDLQEDSIRVLPSLRVKRRLRYLLFSGVLLQVSISLPWCRQRGELGLLRRDPCLYLCE